MKLYSYFRSSASYRVRIALNLKGLAYEILPLHLIKDGGRHLSAEYAQINPEKLLPALQVEDHSHLHTLTQSLAIIEYLEETYPQPPLLPHDALDRAYVRALALAIACDIHPLNNLRVLKYVKNTLNAGEEGKDTWYRYWCQSGLEAVQAQVTQHGKAGQFCLGDTPTMADLCLVPQWFNAQRFNTDVSGCPTLAAIVANCMQLKSFEDASPNKQPDAE
jgi:maleylpyruvate isomerase